METEETSRHHESTLSVEFIDAAIAHLQKLKENKELDLTAYMSYDLVRRVKEVNCGIGYGAKMHIAGQPYFMLAIVPNAFKNEWADLVERISKSLR